MYDGICVTLKPNTQAYSYLLVIIYAQNQQYRKLHYNKILRLDAAHAKVYGLSILDRHTKESK